jgi:hypothetical protein
MNIPTPTPCRKKAGPACGPPVFGSTRKTRAEVQRCGTAAQGAARNQLAMTS